MSMGPPPPGWPRISSAIYYERGREAIDWLVKAFAFEVKIIVDGEGGRLEHSELVYGEGLIMVAEPSPERAPHTRAPNQVDGINTQNMFAYVDDVEAHYACAKAAGATITTELKTNDYGEGYWADRGYACRDPWGHHWWFAQRIKTY